MAKYKPEPPKDADEKVCELCGDKCENRTGCSRCGRMICPACEAAGDGDEADEPICEECF